MAARRNTVLQPRPATYDEDEIQPGDIDYEYTMMLMRCCPCLRPPAHPLDDMDDDSDDEDMDDDGWDDSAKTTQKKKQDPEKLRSIMSSQEMNVPGGGSAWEVVHGDDGDYWWNKVTGETSWDNPTKTRKRGQTTVSVV